jgi:asparagine synthase (glutamine-hydrolysing)
MERYGIISGVHYSIRDVCRLTGMTADHVHDLVQQVLANTYASVQRLPRADGLRNAELFARMDMLLMVPEHYNMRLDRTTMCESVEARVPLQDLDLVGFVAQLPHDELMRGGLKGMLKEAFADVLPAEIVNRPKQTFQAPMASWISGAFAPWITGQMAGATGPELTEWSDARRETNSTRQAYRMWSLALFEGWRRAFALEY